MATRLKVSTNKTETSMNQRGPMKALAAWIKDSNQVMVFQGHLL